MAKNELTLWSFILAVMMLLPVVVSCGGDSDGDTNPIPEKKAPTVNGKRLIRINRYEDRTNQNVIVYAFEYNPSGQVSKITARSAKAVMNYIYEQDKISRDYYRVDYNGATSLYSNYNYYLNYGIITNEEFSQRYVAFYEYNMGNLRKVKVNCKEFGNSSLGGSYGEVNSYVNHEYVYQYEWQNGNISRIRRERSTETIRTTENGNEIVSGPTTTYSKGTTDVQIKYTDYSCCIPFLELEKELLGVDPYLLWQGFAGHNCKNLPSEINLESNDNHLLFNSFNAKYTYEFTHGLLTKITEAQSIMGQRDDIILILEWE